MTEEMITIPKVTGQILFDALVQSMDFGSGFLDTEAVEALRGMAVAIGVDPNVATPDEFKKDYPHPFKMPPSRQLAAQRLGLLAQESTPWVFGKRPETINTIDESRMPDYMPCMIGSWNRSCNKPETDPIHAVS